MEKSDIQILLSREQSSMASNWEEHLGFVKEAENVWRIGNFGYHWIGSIYDLIPEDDLYGSDGELLVPETWNGQKITGLADGEYLQTDELVTADDVEFTSSKLGEALEFCKSNGWSDHPKFDLAWLQIETSVKPSEALSKRYALKGMPLLRAGASASLSGYCASELAIYRGRSETLFWVWNSESESECLQKFESVLGFGQIVRAVVEEDRFSVEVDWDDLVTSSLNKSAAVVLASAWTFDEGSRAAARLISKIPDQTLLPFLDRVSLEGIELAHLGQRVQDYADSHDIDLNDIKSIRPRQLSDVISLEKCLMGALSRASRRQLRANIDRDKRLTQFESTISRLIDAYCKGRPKRYYPGAGYILPPVGAPSLRRFLNSYVLEHQALPEGTIQVPYDNMEIGKPSGETFSVDLDSLER